LEDIVLFPLFHPTRHIRDYAKRLDYPNPGPAVWRERLSALGLEEAQQLERLRPWRRISQLFGTRYETNIEGIWGSRDRFRENQTSG
jgi:hypothetical protein